MAIPEPELLGTKSNRVSRWQHVQKMSQHFWNRWHKEYLSQLQTRFKWNIKRSSEIKLDTLVLLYEDNLPPTKWRIGRVIELFSGSDDIVRVADVKTSNGIVRRAVSRLCPLPIHSSEVPE